VARFKDCCLAQFEVLPNYRIVDAQIRTAREMRARVVSAVS